MKRAALFALLVIGINGIAQAAREDDHAAREAAIQWLQFMDAGRYEEAASQGSTEVRSFEQWLSDFKNRRSELGRLKRRQFVEQKRAAIIAGVPEVRSYNILRFKSSFENPPPLLEEIVLSKVGCCWEIFQYKLTPIEQSK